MSHPEGSRTRVETTKVTVRCTGNVHEVVGKATFEYEFAGSTLRDFLEAFFADYDVEEYLIATGEQSERAHGWAPPPENLPGTWKRNPPGDNVRHFARILVNGTFNEHLDGFETELHDSDRVALMHPFVFCV